MSFFGDYSNNAQPVTWVGTHPIYVANVAVIVHAAAMIACSLLMAGGMGFGTDIAGRSMFSQNGVVGFFLFDSTQILDGYQIWRLVTWQLVATASFDFAIRWGVFWFYAPEVEKALGRKAFFYFYFAFVLISAAFMLLLSTVSMGSVIRSGGQEITWGIFVAFVFLYPDALFYFVGIPNKVLMWIIFGILVLQNLMHHDTVGLMCLLLTTGVAYAGVRISGWGGKSLWIVDKYEEWKAARQARKLHLHVVREQKADEDMDAILDQISREGMGSLTPSQKAALEKGRAHLMKRDKKR